MKKILITLVCFSAVIFSIHAQTLYGTTSKGGNDGGGTIHTFSIDGGNGTVARSFASIPFQVGYTNLIQANDGKLYGTTGQGGSKNAGILFSYVPGSSTYNKLIDFDKVKGSSPWGSLLQASDGKLYGMTLSGGDNNSGVIFSFDISSSTYVKLKDFNAADGSSPFGTLMQASNGKLYGTTTYGGGSNAGVIFSFEPASHTYKKLKDFDNVNGANPRSRLIQASNGKLYGTTAYGGSSDGGVIFSFEPSTNTYSKLIDFDNSSGIYMGLNPGGLVQAGDQKLYGTTFSGGTNNKGVIFSFDPALRLYTKLKDFEATNGAGPFGSLIQASDGKLYGTTINGKAGEINSGYGVIFSFDPSSSTYSNLKDFDFTNGGIPFGGLVQASDEKLYGLASGGVIGVIYSLDIASSDYTRETDFGFNENGNNASASLIKATDGKLYGMTVNGGSSGYGVIFSFDPSSSTYTKLKDFDTTSGKNPNGSLVQATNGKLYGLTSRGGNNHAGVIFSLDPTSSTYTKLKDFDFGSATGASPNGSLIQANDGKLYGVTSGGSAGGNGVIFSFDPAASVYVKLKNFSAANGTKPLGSLLQANDGKLYGITSGGGSNRGGTLFSFDPATAAYIKLKDFDNATGDRPSGNLIQAGNGKLYGMTTNGGSNKGGIIFSFDPLTLVYTKLKDFDNTNGSKPFGSLMQASNGKLYGTTNEGGSNNLGVIFSFDPSSSAYTKLKDYNGENGANPSYGSAFIEINDSVTKVPPAVSLIIPANNATYLSGGNVYLTATASDADGTISKVEFYNGATLLSTVTDTPYTFKWPHVNTGNYTLTAKATDNDGLVTTSNSVYISVVPNKAPVVSIINPANGQSFLNGGNIHIEAGAQDPDGRITKVELYNGITLLATERKLPYTFDWKNVTVGNYIFIAKATDNWGAVTISAAINVSVVPNNAPSVSIISPANGISFTPLATINPETADEDPDGRIIKVDFYNGAKLLATERKIPYTYRWVNILSGSYMFTAVAQDNRGAITTSAPETVTVASAGATISGRSSQLNNKTTIDDLISLQLAPNPAKTVLNIYIKGRQNNKPTSVSVITARGVVMKQMRSAGSIQNIQVDVSSMASGVYTIKAVSGERVIYKKFVKL